MHVKNLAGINVTVSSSRRVVNSSENMRCTIPEISWHNRDPVLSIDIQAGVYKTPKGDTFWRICTGGADSHVLIWHLMINETGSTIVNCVTDLERHQKAVNVVRFSPSKEILASGDDESVIILWKQKEECDFFASINEAENMEQWTSWKVLKGHLEDIYDISWSPDSNSLVSGSVDNTAILWDVQKGRSTGILSDHKGFVQGVAWDPCNQYVCTLGTDRYCRLIDINTKKTVQKVLKSKIPTPSGHPLEGKTVRLFHDDTFKSFFRRLTFSIDGTLILVPSGIIEPQETTERMSNATVIFSRHSLKEPIMILPSLDECTIAIRCCPVYFELHEDGPTPLLTLPYRMVFAVATQRSVLLYDTQQTSPIAMISNIHYTRLTDVAWSSDGQILTVCSTDGYCSIIHFNEGELGKVYKNSDESLPATVVSNSSKLDNKKKSIVSDQQSLTIDIDNNAMDVDIVKCNKKNSAADQPVKAKQQKLINESMKQQVSSVTQEPVKSKPDDEETEDIKLVYNEETSDDNVKTNVKKTPPKTEIPVLVSSRTPRRVELITLSSPKSAKRGTTAD